MSVVHPIVRAWISTGGTGAQNYDEFPDESEITRIITANPESALAIEMPHRAPPSAGSDFASALPAAAERLARQRADGSYAPAENVLALYRISEPGRPDEAMHGLFAMVDTDQISTRADEPGLIIRNEEVFIEKVRERVALAQAVRHLLSPVLLLQTAPDQALGTALREAVEAAGAPAVTDTDHMGRTHAVWPVPVGAAATRLAELAGAGELVVADGNHRSLAAQLGGLPRFLAVITTPDSVTIQPYHRLITESPVPVDELLDRLTAAGARVTAELGPPVIPAAGSIQLYAPGTAYRIDLPGAIDQPGATALDPAASVPGASVPGASVVDRLDHAIVERLVLRETLGLDPGDKRITYVGGDYPPQWLADQVDSGRAELAILIAPVTVADFVAVNLARLRMPRKSTWFTPKARAGLVLAELDA